MRAVPIAVLLVLAATGCAVGPDLNEDQEAQAKAGIVEVAGSVGLVLEDDDVSCVYTRLTSDEARALIGGEAIAELAQPLVDCLGSTAVGVAALAPLAPGASSEAIDCAAQKMDRDLVVAAVERAFGDERPQGAENELAVASALALCLSPEQLLAG